MTIVHRVLAPRPVENFDQWVGRGGGKGLAAARDAGPDVLIAELEASGLRGRGGAGFPTGTKWRTVAGYRAQTRPATVVVNGAEGEPGTFKDRTILRSDPYQVIEGALIASLAVGAGRIVLAVKSSFHRELDRLRAAVDDFRRVGWTDGIDVDVFGGPAEYLYGEETALLEVLDGRQPFPRIAPPFRRGVDEVTEPGARPSPDSGLSAEVEMAVPGSDNVAPPTLVNNVETMANVGRIIARGADWFRTVGTAESPGTIVCTVTGAVTRAGVGEVRMGTPLGEVIEAVGGGPRPGRRIKAVLSGVANAVLGDDALGTPVSYEGMAAAGSGLGSAGFMVLDDETDVVAFAAGVSRFLAVESCGQCTPCKQDGLFLADALDALSRSGADSTTRGAIESRVGTVADEARCFLASQHQIVLDSVLRRFPDEVEAHLSGRAGGVGPTLVTELLDIDDGVAVLDDAYRDKQPDWTYGGTWTGQAPADRLDDHRAHPPS